MLKKLLKYDLKYMIKNMYIFYILAIFFSVFTRIFFALKQTFIINLIGNIGMGCMFSMVFSILINTIIRSWVRFKDSLYKDESYLTHTLPISRTAIFESRFIQSLIFSIISFIVIIASLLITFYSKERMEMIKDVITNISSELNLNTLVFCFSIIGVFFLEIINAIQCGFLGIIEGHRKNNNKIAMSFVLGFISYMISQIVVILFLAISGIFNNKILDLFKNEIIIDNSVFKLLIILAITFYSIIIVLMNLVCNKELKKGVDIE